MAFSSSRLGLARKSVTLVAAGALTLGLTGAVGAASPDELIKACVDKSTKIVRISIYASPTWCESDEAYKQWSVNGPVGPAGPQGAAGVAGAAGATGPAGPAGPEGPAGPAGADGDGIPGPEGPAGPAGADGEDGATGPEGPAGPAGADGAAGPEGPAGPAGADGATGPEGPAGPAGDDGADATIGLVRIVSDSPTEEADADTGEQTTDTVACTGDLVAYGGGGTLVDSSGDAQSAVYASYPSSATEWTFTAKTIIDWSEGGGNASDNLVVTAYVLCGNP